jgi:hypothetical protein
VRLLVGGAVNPQMGTRIAKDRLACGLGNLGLSATGRPEKQCNPEGPPAVVHAGKEGLIHTAEEANRRILPDHPRRQAGLESATATATLFYIKAPILIVRKPFKQRVHHSSLRQVELQIALQRK